MRIALAAAALGALCTATPAAATQGQSCRVLSGNGPSIGIVIGSTGIAGASLTETGGATRHTMAPDASLAIAQAWIDEQRLWIDLTDPNHLRSEGRLRLAWVGRGRTRHLAGTFVSGGRLYRVRCEES